MKWMLVAHIVVLTILSFSTRFYKVCEPDVVSWDETHFGKFASFYLKNENYFDVHPPLGKMMLAGFGWVYGYNGSFSFSDPGQEYGAMPYCGLRKCCATLGTMLPLFLYGVIALQVNANAGLLAAVLMICDTGLITLTQFILLESPLFFFMCAMLFFYTLTSKLESWTVAWYVALALTGVCVGCILSVKYIGLFAVIYIGLQVIDKLYGVACDPGISLPHLAKHLAIRVLLLILVPIVLYMTFFTLHFAIIYKSSEHDGSYSPEYQASLEGNSLAGITNDKHLNYGSKLRLRNDGCLLHSHQLTYPDTQLNQATGYSHRDENNFWEITPHIGGERSYVGNGDVVKLKHLSTNRYLYSHSNKSYYTPANKQVGTHEAADDAGVFWQVYSAGAMLGAKIETYTAIVLVHVEQRCGVSMGGEKLPQWGAGQIEVSCLSRWHSVPSSVQFVVEYNMSPDPARNTEPVPRAGFLAKFVEMQIKMLKTNNDLKPAENEATSRPWHWPIAYDGIWFAIHQRTGNVYFLGNPLIFWFNLLCIGLYVVLWLVISYATMRQQVWVRPYVSSLTSAHWYMTGYLLHYVPFYMMGRVLYQHHFYSAFLFNCMLSGTVIEMLISLVADRVGRTGQCDRVGRTAQFTDSKGLLKMSLQGLVVSSAVGSFLLFCPLCYGIPIDENKQTIGHMKSLKWMASWQF